MTTPLVDLGNLEIPGQFFSCHLRSCSDERSSAASAIYWWNPSLVAVAVGTGTLPNDPGWWCEYCIDDHKGKGRPNAEYPPLVSLDEHMEFMESLSEYGEAISESDGRAVDTENLYLTGINGVALPVPLYACEYDNGHEICSYTYPPDELWRCIVYRINPETLEVVGVQQKGWYCEDCKSEIDTANHLAIIQIGPTMDVVLAMGEQAMTTSHPPTNGKHPAGQEVDYSDDGNDEND